MKRPWLLLLIPVAMLAFAGAAANRISFTHEVIPHSPWRLIGSITDSNDTIDVEDRAYSDAWGLPDANTVAWNVPAGVDEVEFRFETDADADADVIEIWVAANDYLYGSSSEDSFTLGAILTLTGGTHVGTNSNVFVDTLTVESTDPNGILIAADTLYDSADNRIAIWSVPLRGYKKVLMIATTLEASSTLYAYARWH